MNIESKNYLANEYNMSLFAGYYNYINGNFKEDFELPTNETEFSLINLPYLCNSECFNKEERVKFDAIEELVDDGGFTFYTKSQIENKSIFLSAASVNAWVIKVIEESKFNGSFVSPLDYNNKYLFAKDLFIGGEYYDVIGVKMNKPAVPMGSVLNFINPKLDYYEDEGAFFNWSIKVDTDVFVAAFDEIGACNLSDSYYEIDNVNGFDNILTQNTAKTQALFNFIIDAEAPENLLIFANGYRINTGIFTFKKFFDNWDQFFNSDYERESNIRFVDFYEDSGEYWGDLDNLFTDRIGTKNVIYADGHDDILTSNHNNLYTYDQDGVADIKKSKLSLAIGFASTLQTRGKYLQYPLVKSFVKNIDSQAGEAIPSYSSECVNNPTCLNLDLNSNEDGFDVRFSNGRIYGLKLASWIESDKIKIKKNDAGEVIGKIDIVAHSMGYAFAAGIIDALIQEDIVREDNKLGSFYALAPENANGKIVSEIIENTEYLWQYGTEEIGSVNAHEPHHQDGIAPQVAIPGLGFNSTELDKGRVRYDGTLSKWGFGIHHLGVNYTWTLDIDEDDKGYVKKRD